MAAMGRGRTVDAACVAVSLGEQRIRITGNDDDVSRGHAQRVVQRIRDDVCCVSLTMHLASWALNACALRCHPTDGDETTATTVFDGLDMAQAARSAVYAVKGPECSTRTTDAELRLREELHAELDVDDDVRTLCEADTLSRANRSQIFAFACNAYETSALEHFKRTVPRVIEGYIKWHVAQLADGEGDDDGGVIRGAWWKMVGPLVRAAQELIPIDALTWTVTVRRRRRVDATGDAGDAVVDLLELRPGGVERLKDAVRDLVRRKPSAMGGWTKELLRPRAWATYATLVVSRRGEVPHEAVKIAMENVDKRIPRLFMSGDRRIVPAAFKWKIRVRVQDSTSDGARTTTHQVDIAEMFPEIRSLVEGAVSETLKATLPVDRRSVGARGFMDAQWSQFIPFLRWMQEQADMCCASYADPVSNDDPEGDGLVSRSSADSVQPSTGTVTESRRHRRRRAPLRSFSIFPMCKTGRRFVTYDARAVDQLRGALWPTRGAKRKHADRDAPVSLTVPDEIRRCPKQDPASVHAVFNSSPGTSVNAPRDDMVLRSVSTDGATLILRFTTRGEAGGEDATEYRRTAFNGSVFNMALRDASKELRETPIPDSVRNVKEMGGVTTLENLRTAVLRTGLGDSSIRVVGTDPGRESLVYCASVDLDARGGGRAYGWSDDDQRYVRREVADQLVSPRKGGCLYRMTSIRHLWLSGKMSHRRAELRWRESTGVQSSWDAMNGAGEWKTGSLVRFQARMAMQARPDNWARVMDYTFGGDARLARLSRRLRFCMQRHVSVTANVIAGLRRDPCSKKGKRKKRKRRKGKHGRRHVRRRPSQVSPKNRPALTVVAMGNGVFSACSRGYAPSSHRPYVRELAHRPGVIVAMVDEFRTSKCCFRCGSEMEMGVRIPGSGVEVVNESRIATCRTCFSAVPVSSTSPSPGVNGRLNRDLNGAANMCLLACRALSFVPGAEVRPPPWRRGVRLPV